MITIPDAMRRPAEVERDELKKQLAEARADAEHWKGECSDLVRKAHEMCAEIDYFQTLIDLQHKRTVEADKLWQVAHNKPDVWPDLGALIEWLLLRLKNQETIIEANRAAIKDKDALIEQMREALIEALQSADSEWENKNLGHDWEYACEQMRAALEAAERDE